MSNYNDLFGSPYEYGLPSVPGAPSTNGLLKSLLSFTFGSFLILLLITGIVLLCIWGKWKMYKLLDKPGWMSLLQLSVLRDFPLFDFLYGNGWKALFRFVPLYGIYILLKARYDLAKAFGKGTFGGILAILFPDLVFAVIGFSGTFPVEVDNSKCPTDSLKHFVRAALKELGLIRDTEDFVVAAKPETPTARVVKESNKCPKCGFINTENSSFCENCGTKLIK